MIRFGKKLKRLMAMLLSVLMLIGVFPMPAYAQEDLPEEQTALEETAEELTLPGEPAPEEDQPEPAVPEESETEEAAEDPWGETGEAQEQPEADEEIRVGQFVSQALTEEKDSYTLRLRVELGARYRMILTGAVGIEVLNERDMGLLCYAARKDENSEWVPVEESLDLEEGTYFLTVAAAEELPWEELPFTLLFEEQPEPAEAETVQLADAAADLEELFAEDADLTEEEDGDVGADYTFPQETVKLVDILNAVGATAANNSTLSVDSDLIHLSETTVKNKNRNSITLTALDYFDLATLTITRKGREQTISLSYPEPPVQLIDYGEQSPLKPQVPADAIWANDVLYLTGKMPGNAIVEANPVTLEIDGEYVIAAYDIKIYANANQQRKGKTWQPAGDKVQVHFFAAESEDMIHVYHLPDASDTAELVDTVEAENGWIAFDAEHFSTYGFSFFEDLFDHTVNAVRDALYPNTVYENDEIILSGNLPRNAVIAAERKDLTIGDEDALIAYDITIYQNSFFKLLGIAWQPKEGAISVRLKSDALDAESVNVYHMADTEAEPELVSEGLTVEDGSVTFPAESFSVYAIIPAPTPTEPISTDVTTLADIVENQGYTMAIARSGVNYMTSTAATGSVGEFVGSTAPANAETWYFESNGEAGKFYIYRQNDTEREYLYIYNNTDKFRLDGSSKTLFTVEETRNAPGTFYIYSRGTDGINYALSVRSVRNFFLEKRNNGAHAFERVVLTKVVTIPDDPFDLDGKTYSIAYHEESVKGAGLTATAKQVSNKAGLAATELIVRPDVLNSSGELLIAEGIDLTEWTFTLVDQNRYYVTTEIGGTSYYLTGSNANLTLESAPTANSIVTVDVGSGETAGKYRFSFGDGALTLSGGRVSNGFVDSNNGGQYSWLSLVQKTPLLQDDDFAVYSAEKVDLSDRTQVPDGSVVVLYTRYWNDTTKKYEFYAVNYDGSLVRAFESGDMIQWVGSTVNTVTWDFTEYQYDDGSPTFFYQLKNTYSQDCIRPQNDGAFLRSERDYPSMFDRSINLNGRRYGYYYSTVQAWDDDSYSYIALRVKDDRSGVEVCDMSEADTFYFAIMAETPGDDQNEPLIPVETIDHTAYGITMRIKDFKNRAEMSGYLNRGQSGTVYDPGILSTDLDETTGYPKAVFKNNTSLSGMFSGATEVNNLFIANTYYSSGYYEYDSAQNFATLVKPNGTIGNTFTVYNQLGSYDGENGVQEKPTLQHGQFLPFNTIVPGVFPSANSYNLYPTVTSMKFEDAVQLPDSDPRKGERLYDVEHSGQPNEKADLYFAVEIEASFTQTANGHDAWGHDIIYEFTGDDDFWLYVDGELIIDLGGVHSALAGSVNYCTGEVVVNGQHKTLYQLFYDNYKGRGHSDAETQAYVDEIFQAKTIGGETRYVFKDYTEHTMRIFYMERGGGASNLHMRFNLASVKPGTVLLNKEIDGVDNTESFMAEYPFQIFYKKSMEDSEGGEGSESGSGSEGGESGEGGSEDLYSDFQQLSSASEGGVRVVYKDTNRYVTFKPTYTAPDGVSYNNVFMLRPGEIAEIGFPDQTDSYYIVECAVDITVMDNETTPPQTIHQGIYTGVSVNGEEMSGVDNGGGKYRQDFKASPAKVSERTRVTFQNHVDPNAKGTLTFVKHLYEENGVTPIPHADNDTVFTFRLYLGTENDADPPLADMYSYHVKDDSGNYCRWDASLGKLVPLGAGKNDYDALTAAEKRQITFTTSMSGSISNIPVDYTVEVREIPAGTKYKVEERDYEMPDGYTLQWYVTTVEGQSEPVTSTTPAAGIINVVSSYNHIEVRNLKGWGLRALKQWPDAAWMEGRDPVYFAVYIGTDGNSDGDYEDAGELSLVDGTVKQLVYGEESVYWFFKTVDDLNGDGVKSEVDFSRYIVREITLSGAQHDGDGNLTGYTAIDQVLAPGDSFVLNGTAIGDPAPSALTYTVVSYTQGTLTAGSNVRKDTVVNKRAGIDLYKMQWDGVTPLPGAVFTLTYQETVEGVEETRNAGAGSFTADENGLITIAYLRENVDYTLTETVSPAGYLGLPTQLRIRRSGSDVTVTALESGHESYYSLDDQDLSSGTDIRFGKLIIKNKPETFQIKKTSSVTGDALQGVAFALYRQVTGNDGNPRKDFRPIPGYENLVTDANGFVPEISENFLNGSLGAGTYYLYESHPLLGYRPLESDVVFSIGENGEITLVSAPSDVTLTDPNNDSSFVITVPNKDAGTTDLTVEKTVVNGTTADENGTNTFNFTAKLYLPDGVTTWDYQGTGFSKGTKTFALGHGQSTVLTVPLGAIVKISETGNNAYETTASEVRATTEGQSTTSVSSFNSANLTSTLTINDNTAISLTYTNTRKTVQVNLKKTVVGNGGSFDFTAVLKDGATLCGSWTMNQAAGVVTGADGKARITLNPANNSSKQITLTIPYGTELSITEDRYGNYTTKVGNTETRTWTMRNITAKQNVTFTNTASLIAPTGLMVALMPFVWTAAAGALMLTVSLRRKRTKEKSGL